jgi:LysM repeat protein
LCSAASTDKKEAEVTTAAHRLRFVVAWIGLLVVAIGIPILLVRIAGYPLPTSMPAWSRISIAIRQGDIPAMTVIKTVVVAIWLIWAQFMWAVAWEFAVNVPRTSRGHQPRVPPLVPSGVSSLAGRFVAILLSVGLATITSSPVVALNTPTAVVSSTRAFVAVEATASSTSVATPVTAGTWRVESGDSLWAIAEHALGDGSRVGEILELNPMLQSARDLRVGQTLALPADAEIPIELQRPVSTDVAAAQDDELVAELPAAPYAPQTVITIQHGDTLWDLSERQLTIAGDADVSGHEILQYLDIVIAANPDVIENPNLIFPGQQFVFPQIGIPPPPPVLLPPPVVSLPPVALPPPAPPINVPLIPAVVASTPPPTSTVEAVNQAPPTPVAANDRGPASLDQASPATSNSQAGGNGTLMPWLAGVSGSTILAVGALGLFRRRRTAVAARGASRFRQPRSPSATRTEQQLIAAADLPLVRWASQELSTLVYGLDPRQIKGGPVAVEFSEQRGIELLWDAQNPSAPRPWEATDGGWAWRLLYDPDVEVPNTPLPPAIPGLVTVGRRDGSQVLVDLEAYGSLSITGTDGAVDEFARSMILELATGEEISDVYLHLVDITLWEAGTTLPRTQERCEDDAIAHLREIAGDTTRLLNDSRVPTTFHLRAGHKPEGRELTVAVVRADRCEHLNELIELAKPRTGIALVILGAAVDAAATVTLHSTVHAVLAPLGLDFEPVGVPVETGLALDEFLHPPVDAHIELPSIGVNNGHDDVTAVTFVEGPSGQQPLPIDDESDDDWTTPQPELLVRVLGVPTIDGYANLGRIELNIVTFLACSGGQATEDQVIDAVWNGRLVEQTTLWNRISKARSVLGRFIPAREQGTRLIRLHAELMTDLQVLAALVERAEVVSSYEAIDLLVGALDLVHGVPFDTVGYEWAHEHQHHARACELIETASLRLVDLALEADDPNAARRAISQGLIALKINEPLYRARMKVEAHIGNAGGIRAAYAELAGLMSELDDDESFAPSAQTSVLYERLMAT